MNDLISGAKAPWARQPGETDKAFESFAWYRDMGPGRSIPKVCREHSKNESLLKRWSAQNRWGERVSAWDDENDRQTRYAFAKGITDMRRKHIDAANEMLTKALEHMRRISSIDVSLADVARAVDTAVKIERLSRGEPTEFAEGRAEFSGKLTVEANPYDGLTTEELRILAKYADEKGL